MAVVEQFAHIAAALAHALVPMARDRAELVCSPVEPCINRGVSLDGTRKAQQLDSTAHGGHLSHINIRFWPRRMRGAARGVDQQRAVRFQPHTSPHLFVISETLYSFP
jgi:hypothetical protein